MSNRQSVFSELFHEPTSKRLQVMAPKTEFGSVHEALVNMDTPQIQKIKNPPVPVLDIDGTQRVDDHGDLMYVDTDQYSLIRTNSFQGDDNPEYYATVGEGYELVDAWAVADMLDSMPKFSPDSVRFANGGKNLLIQQKIDEIDIALPYLADQASQRRWIQGEREKWGYDGSDDLNGGVCDVNFFLNNPMGGNGTITGGLTARVKVCANGMTSKGAVATFSIRHTAGATEHLNEWLVHLYAKVYAEIPVFKAQLQRLAETPVTLDKMRWIAGTKLYPQREMQSQKEFESTPKRQSWEDYSRGVDAENAKNEQKASAIVSLFKGIGRGIPAYEVERTGWDALMAVSEFENYKRTRRVDETAPIKFMEGERADRIHQTMELVLA